MRKIVLQFTELVKRNLLCVTHTRNMYDNKFFAATKYAGAPRASVQDPVQDHAALVKPILTLSVIKLCHILSFSLI
jgi:hypothetical protein